MRIFFFLIFILVSISSIAQRYGFRNYDVRSGLTHSQVRSLAQDKHGYLWVGTLGGLSRFDGREFVQYTADEGFNFDQIDCLLELSSGEMAAGSVGAIARISSTETKIIELGKGYERTAIQQLYEDDENNIWLASQAGIFLIPEGSNIVEPWKNRIFGKEDVRKIFKKEDQFIVLTSSALIEINDNSIDTLYKAYDESFTDFIVQENGLWICSNGGGLIYINNDKKTTIRLTADNGLISNRILSICSDFEGGLWVASRLGMSHVSAESKISNLNAQNGLINTEIRCAIVDNEHNLWMGSDGGGLFRFLGDEFAQFTDLEGLPSNLIMCMSRDFENNLWLGTFDKGIYKMGPEPKHISWIEGLANDKVWTSLCDSKGRMWFGTSGGLSVLENGVIRSLEQSDGLASNKILSLFEDSSGILWVGTSAGVNLIDPNSLNVLPGSDLTETKIRMIFQDVQGNMWFATSRGICKKTNSNLQWFELEESDDEESCSSLAQDAEGRIWAGAKNGAYLFDKGNFSRIKLGENHSSNFVNFLQPLPEGMLAGTNNGLYLITGVKGAAKKVYHFGLNDGLGSLETNMNASFYEKDGTLWFGTTAGLMRHTGTFLSELVDLPVPAAHLTDVRLNLSPTDWSNKADSVNWLSGLPMGLNLPFNQNHFTFLFNAISHRYPEEVYYRFKLDGFDDDWQPLTETPFATYANLPDGDFTFLVQACGKDSIWSEADSISLSVSPPFWKTWWFILLSALLLIGLAWLILKRRKERLYTELEKEKFELRSKLLTLEQQSLNSSMNRHFIFNALNSIQYYINRQDKHSANKYLASFARLIRKNLDSSQVNHTSLSEELDRLELYLQLEHMRFQDKFDYEIEVDDEVDAGNIRVPSMLLQPFLENSIWHGILPKGDRGKVTLKVTEEKDDQVVFTITDNGIGIAASLKNKIEDDTHISQGMNITKGRLDLIKKMTGKDAGLEGPTDIISDEGIVLGTVVKIKIPLTWTISLS